MDSLVSLTRSQKRRFKRLILERRMREVLGRGINVEKLCSASQSLFESFAILLEAMRDNRLAPGSVAIIGMNPHRYASGREEVIAKVRAPLIPFLDHRGAAERVIENESIPGRFRLLTQRGVARHWIEQRLRNSRNWLDGDWLAPLPYLEYAWPDRPLPTNEKHKHAHAVASWLGKDFEGSHDFAQNVARQLVASLRDEDIEVVMLQLPRDSRIVDVYQPYAETYETHLAELYELGARPWDLRTLGLDDDAFSDLFHVRPGAPRDALTTVFIQRLTRLLGGSEGTPLGR